MWDSWYTNSVFCQVRYRNQCPLLCLAESRCLGYRMSNAPGVGATVCEYILDYWLQFALILDTQKRVCAHHLAMIGNEFSNHKMQYHIFLIVWFKPLITVGKELRQQHPSDLSSGGRDVQRAQLDYNMTKQRCIKRIYDRIRSKSPPNRATLPTCLHCDVTHPSLTTGVVALRIPSRRVGVREESRQGLALLTLSWDKNCDSHSPMNGYPSFLSQDSVSSAKPRHVKLCSPLKQEGWFVTIKIIYVESSITTNI